MEQAVRLTSPMSDGDGIQVAIECHDGGAEPACCIYRTKPEQGMCQDVEDGYLIQTDDLLTAAEFFLACARMCQLAGKQHAERLEQKSKP